MEHINDEIMVSINCLVYNHEPYLRQCLDGFVMQQTNFRFEAVVHEDVSTDGSAAIIREYAQKYPDIIKPIYETENQYSKGDGSLRKIMMNACKGKYVAMCEGDDFWVDPLKLQKQVDFLENHPEYGMCYSDFNMLDMSTSTLKERMHHTSSQKYPMKYDKIEDFIMALGYTAPPSWMYRKAIMADYTPIAGALDGTFVMFTFFLAKTKVYFMDEPMVTYRVLEESASHSKNPQKLYVRLQNLLKTQCQLIEMYGVDSSVKDKCICDYYQRSLYFFVKNGYKKEVADAQKYLVNPTRYERLLMRLGKMNAPKAIVKCVHKLWGE